MSEHDKEAIRAQIHSAFSNVVAPEHVDEMLAKPFLSNEDAGEMAAAFFGKQWSAISRAELFRHRESLFALSPAAYRYFLPAYLEASLASEDPLDTYGADIRAYLLYSLGATSSNSLVRMETTRARLAALDRAQRHAISAVLQILEQRWHMRDASELLHDWER